jgi:hypothetical protein
MKDETPGNKMIIYRGFAKLYAVTGFTGPPPPSGLLANVPRSAFGKRKPS